MKTNIKLLASLFMIGTLAFSSCGNTNQSHKEQSVEEQTKGKRYQCPMECEGRKTYAAPGDCPICEMEMDEVGEL